MEHTPVEEKQDKKQENVPDPMQTPFSNSHFYFKLTIFQQFFFCFLHTKKSIHHKKEHLTLNMQSFRAHQKASYIE